MQRIQHQVCGGDAVFAIWEVILPSEYARSLSNLKSVMLDLDNY